MRTGVFIDDSGNPGMLTDNIFDAKYRKSWYAIILSPQQREDADFGMRQLIAEHDGRYGEKEFHFTDIYNGKGKFKDVPLNDRLVIFEHFAGIFSEFQYPILSHTMTFEDFERNKISTVNLKFKADNFRVAEASDFALYFLLVKSRLFLDVHPEYSCPIDVVIDSGRQAAETFQKADVLGEKLHDGKLQYRSSHDEPLLQLADFAAFCLNRAYRLNQKAKRSSLDEHMRKILSDANFNTINIRKQIIHINDDTRQMHESLLEEAYSKNMPFDNIELEELIQTLIAK